MTADPILRISAVVKSYHALRPLRIQELTVGAVERVALGGLDAGAAELLVNLVTGASLPDQGEVVVMGQPTSAIDDGDAWLASLDRFGIVSERSVMLDSSSVEQNLAMPFTLQLDPVPPADAARAAALAHACGMWGAPPGGEEGGWLVRPAGTVPPEIRIRIHLARALALEPRLLVFEHPTAGLPEDARAAFAEDVARVTDERRIAALVVTEDHAFARLVAHRALRLEPATGAVRPVRRSWFS